MSTRSGLLYHSETAGTLANREEGAEPMAGTMGGRVEIPDGEAIEERRREQEREIRDEEERRGRLEEERIRREESERQKDVMKRMLHGADGRQNHGKSTAGKRRSTGTTYRER